MKYGVPFILVMTWMSLWFTPDQLGQHYYRQGHYEKAANTFQNQLWKGISEFKAGDFTSTVQTFARVDSAKGHYNQGNAQVMLGHYEAAVTSYDRALAKRPDWREAKENRALAQARAEMLQTEGGNMTEGQMEPDEIVFDNKKPSDESISTEIAGAQELSDAEMQALWLRRVQTRPADFLKAKFAYQQSIKSEDAQP